MVDLLLGSGSDGEGDGAVGEDGLLLGDDESDDDAMKTGEKEEGSLK